MRQGWAVWNKLPLANTDAFARTHRLDKEFQLRNREMPAFARYIMVPPLTFGANENQIIRIFYTLPCEPVTFSVDIAQFHSKIIKTTSNTLKLIVLS